MSRRMSVLPASSASAAGQKDQDLSDTLAKGITEGIDRGPSPSTVVLPMETLLKEAIRTAISKTRLQDLGMTAYASLVPDSSKKAKLQQAHEVMYRSIQSEIVQSICQSDVMEGIIEHVEQYGSNLCGSVKMVLEVGMTEFIKSNLELIEKGHGVLTVAETERWEAVKSAHSELTDLLEALQKKYSTNHRAKLNTGVRDGELQQADIMAAELAAMLQAQTDWTDAGRDIAAFVPERDALQYLVDAGVNAGDIFKTPAELEELTVANDKRLQRTLGALKRSGDEKEMAVTSALHVNLTFASKSKELCDIKVNMPKELNGIRSPVVARQFMKSVRGICSSSPSHFAILVNDLEFMFSTLHYTGAGWRPSKLASGYDHLPVELRKTYKTASKELYDVLLVLIPDTAKVWSMQLESPLTIGVTSIAGDSKWISQVAESDGLAAVDWVLHYHEKHGKQDREQMLVYFKSVHIEFKAATDLTDAFDGIDERLQILEAYGDNRVDLPWEDVLKPIAVELTGRHPIFNTICSAVMLPTTVEASADCFHRLVQFTREARSVYNDTSDSKSTLNTAFTAADTALLVSFKSQYPRPSQSGGGGDKGGTAQARTKKKNKANPSHGDGDADYNQRSKPWKCQCVLSASDPTTLCNSLISESTRRSMVERASGKQNALCTSCFVKLKEGGTILMKNKSGQVWKRTWTEGKAQPKQTHMNSGIAMFLEDVASAAAGYSAPESAPKKSAGQAVIFASEDIKSKYDAQVLQNATDDFYVQVASKVKSSKTSQSLMMAKAKEQGLVDASGKLTCNIDDLFASLASE